MTEKKPRKRGPGRPVKKGQVLNPKGRPKIPKETRELAKLCREDFTMRFGAICNMRLSTLNELVVDNDRSVLDHFIARIVLAGINTADQQKLDFIMTKLFGKDPENTNLNLNLTQIHSMLVDQLGSGADS